MNELSSRKTRRPQRSARRPPSAAPMSAERQKTLTQKPQRVSLPGSGSDGLHDSGVRSGTERAARITAAGVFMFALL